MIKRLSFLAILFAASLYGYSNDETTLTDISPSAAMQGETLDVVISGTNCNFDQVTSSSYRYIIFEGVSTGYRFSSSYVSSYSSNSITFSVSIPKNLMAETFKVSYTEYTYNYYYTSRTVELANKTFTVNENPNLPKLTSVDQKYVKQGDKLTVSISGSSANFSQQSTTLVYFRQATNSVKTHQYSSSFYAATSTVKSSNLIQSDVEIPRMANLGYYDVIVKTGGEEFVLNRGMVISENPDRPKLVSVSKNTAKQGEMFEVTLSATNTLFMSASSTANVYIGDSWTETSAVSTTVSDENTLVATFRIPENMPIGLTNIHLNYFDERIMAYINDYIDYYNYEMYTLEDCLEIVASEKNSTGSEMTDNAGLSVYPSVTSGNIHINTPSDISVEIYNINGIKIIETRLVSDGSIDLSTCSSGLYKVRVRTDSSSKIFTIVKR